MTAQGIATVSMAGRQFDFLCVEVLHLSPGETKDAFMVDPETVSIDGSGGRLLIGKILAWRPRLLSAAELAGMRQFLVNANKTLLGNTSPRVATLGQLLRDGPMLLQELERHRTNLAALEENLQHWPNTMTRDRLLSDLRAARTGYHLEMLT